MISQFLKTGKFSVQVYFVISSSGYLLFCWLSVVGSYQALGRATAEVETIEYYLGVEGSWRAVSSEVNKHWNLTGEGTVFKYLDFV